MEAMDMGLIDEVYEPMAVAASFSPEFIGLPAIPKEKLINLNQINMNIFKRKDEKKPVNSLQLGEVTAVFEGELAEGSELVALNGATLEDGEFEMNDQTLVIENSAVKAIKQPNVEEKNQEIDSLNAKVEEQAKLIAEMQETLSSIKSTHKVDDKSEVKEETPEIPHTLHVKNVVKEEIKKLKKEEE